MNELKNKSLMVVGGAGFIGSHLVEALIEEKPKSIVVVDNFFLGEMGNLETAKTKFDVIVENQDACDYEKMKKIVETNKIDVVFNLACVPLPTSLVKPIWTFDQNIGVAKTLCRLIREGSFKTLVHYSSSEVYGTATKETMDEEHSLFPRTPYAAAKAACDHLVNAYYETYGIDMVIIRPFNNFGPRQNDKSYAGVIPLTVKRILNNEQPVIFGDGTQTRDFIFVKDTVNATIDAYKSDQTRGRTINIASGKETSVKDLIDLISQELSYDKPARHDAPRPGDVMRHMGDITLAKKLIGFQPTTDLRKGMKETIDWYKKRHVV